MRFTLTIECDNAAFHNEPPYGPAAGFELAIILRKLAKQLERATDNGTWPVSDSNGNHVGNALLITESPTTQGSII